MELDQLECRLDHIADLVHVLDCFELSINIDWCGNIIKMRICSYIRKSICGCPIGQDTY